MLYRKIESAIEEQLISDSKKILLVDGARQVGKILGAKGIRKA